VPRTGARGGDPGYDKPLILDSGAVSRLDLGKLPIVQNPTRRERGSA
jgi:hypothetical protein